eukprot:COSAG02_NODE_6900_length_3292_cov_3.140625_4_plen_90_part_00
MHHLLSRHSRILMSIVRVRRPEHQLMDNRHHQENSTSTWKEEWPDGSSELQSRAVCSAISAMISRHVAPSASVAAAASRIAPSSPGFRV